MRNHLRFTIYDLRVLMLFIGVLVFSRLAGAQPAQVTATWNFATFTGQSNTIRHFTVAPDPNYPNQAMGTGASGTWLPAGGLIDLTVANFPGITNGTVTTNVAVGQVYDVTLSDGWNTFTFTNYFPLSDSNLVVNAWNRTGIPFLNGQILSFAYFNWGGTNINITQGGGGLTNNATSPWTNTVGVTAPVFNGNATSATTAGSATYATYAQTATNANSATVSTNAIGLGYNVFTNGYMTAAGFVATPGAGEALQGEVNYLASGATAFFGTFSAGFYSTNFVGGTLSAAPGFYYLPNALVVSNEWCSASWVIKGAGPMKTIFCGPSNVLKTTTGSAPPGPFRFELSNIGFVWSNYWSKAIAVDLQGAGALESVHDLYFSDYSAYTNAVGGGIPSPHFVPGYASGIIPLVMAGEWGNQVCKDCFFTGAACGPVFPSPHIRVENLEIDSTGEGELPTGGVIQTNQYATNDTSQVVAGDCGPLMGAFASMGPAMVILGDGDVYVKDIKVGSSGVGIFVCSYPAFGETKIENYHSEEYKNRFVGNADIVIPNSANNSYIIFPTTVLIENSGQDLGLINAYNFDSAAFTFSSKFNPDANDEMSWVQEINTGLSLEDGNWGGAANTPEFVYRVNNQTLFSVDSGQTNPMVGSLGGFTIFSPNTWSRNFTNGLVGVVPFYTASNGIPIIGMYSNGVMYGYQPPMAKF